MSGDSTEVTEPGQAEDRLPGHTLEGLPVRYRLMKYIAQGASGEIWRVQDMQLSRPLALKLLHARYRRSATMRARFTNEAAITAQLQHPGIVAIHEQGELSDGCLWFTMREVRGVTLRQLIEQVHHARATQDDGVGQERVQTRRLVSIYARIVQAVAYAHSRGVVHRDLKPDNLMVGEHGDVLVMDWGLARRLDALDDADDLVADDAPSFDQRLSSLSLAPELTRAGDILGTPAYMPPEQALGQTQLHLPASDVYALGAILRHILSGRPPYAGNAEAIIEQVAAGPPPPLSEPPMTSQRPPAELVAICERAMARDPAARYPTAAALGVDLTAWLDGARKREQAMQLVVQADATLPRLSRLATEANELHAAVAQAQRDVHAHDPLERKLAGWRLEDQLSNLQRDRAIAELEWEQQLHAALSIDPDLGAAHDRLARHYVERLRRAERDGDAAHVARLEILLSAHAKERNSELMRGEGLLSLTTQPSGARVQAARVRPIERRWVPGEPRDLGVTPLRKVAMPHGSYLLFIRAAGHIEVTYPIFIERGEHWEGAETQDGQPLKLPKTGNLAPDMVYVPAGHAWLGGDPDAVDALPARRIWVDSFAIQRHPVTLAAYLRYLDALVERGLDERAAHHCPRGARLDLVRGMPAIRRGPAGRYVISPRADGSPWPLQQPVTLIDWHDAMSFARWSAQQAGHALRLPSELEWEKAARGADARLAPWGRHLDASFCHCIDSQAGDVNLAQIHDRSHDVSPYGVIGLAGNSRDWCIDIWTHEGPPVDAGRLAIEAAVADDPRYRVVRGGAYNSPLQRSRSAARFALRPHQCRAAVGMRLVQPGADIG